MRPLLSRLILILVSALSFSLGSCGGTGSDASTSTTPPAPPEVLYAQAAGEMSAFSIDANSGSLSTIQTLTLPVNLFSSRLGSAGIVATSPAKFFYAADSLEINAYSIAADGTLSLVNGSPFAGNPSFFYITGMAVNPFAFPSGVVENEGYMPIALDSSGKYLYSIGGCQSGTCLTEALIYNVNQSTGALSQAGGSKKSLGDNYLTLASFQAP